jgi:hypothetical protein
LDESDEIDELLTYRRTGCGRLIAPKPFSRAIEFGIELEDFDDCEKQSGSLFCSVVKKQS